MLFDTLLYLVDKDNARVYETYGMSIRKDRPAVGKPVIKVWKHVTYRVVQKKRSPFRCSGVISRLLVIHKLRNLRH